MPIRRKNVDLLRLKRSTKRNKLFECLSSPSVQYLMIFLLWGLLVLINQSTEMQFEYFWPGWLFICSTHDSLKYQGLQYTMFFVIIVLTTDLLFFFLFPPSWICFCGSAYVWIYLLWHTDQGLCFLTLTFCLTFVYFELGFQSRDVKFNHSIYFFRPFAAHSMGYPVVCMGFSIMRYLEVRHRKNKTLNVRRQNCLYFRILRDAVPVSLLTEFSDGTCPTYLPDYEFDMQNSKSTLIPESGDCNLSWSIFLFYHLASCFSRLGQWCFSYPLPLDHEPSNGALVSSHALCSRSNPSGGTGGGGYYGSGCTASPDTGLVDCAENHQLIGACSAGPRPSTNAAGRLRATTTTTAAEAVSSAVGCGSHAAAASTIRQPGGMKTASQPSSSSQTTTAAAAVVSTNNSTATSSRCLKDNTNLRLENAIRRLKGDVQSMRAVESQLRGQLTHLESESQLNRGRLAEQRQANDAMLARIGKLNSRSRSERTGLVGLEHSLAEERRLRALAQEQLTALQAQLAPLVVVDPLSAIGELPPPAEKAVQTSTTTSDTDSSIVPRPVNQLDGESDCCQRRRLLESELRSVCRQHQLQRLSTATDQSASSCDASTRSRGKSAGKTAATVAASSSGSGQRTGEESAVGRHSQSQCQRLVLETCIQAASKERARLEYKLKEENWMKQQLFTEFHNSVGETNSLKNTLKQRDSQISELLQKLDQYERCLSFAAGCDRIRPASLVNRPVDCEQGLTSSQMAARVWTPSPACCSAAGLSGQLQPGKPVGFTGGRSGSGSTDVCHPLLSSLSSPPFKFAPNGSACTASATGYSAEDLSFLMQQATSAVSICDLLALKSSNTCCGGVGGTVTTADSGAGYLSSVRLPEPCSNGGEPFDYVQLSLDCGAGRTTGIGDFLTSTAGTSDTPPATVGKGRRVLHRQAVTLTNEGPPVDSVGYSKGLGESTAASLGPGSSRLQTESL